MNAEQHKAIGGFLDELAELLACHGLALQKNGEQTWIVDRATSNYLIAVVLPDLTTTY